MKQGFRVVIVWNGDFNILKETMEELVSSKNLFLFTVVCGGTEFEGVQNAAGYRWASAVGLPAEYLIEKDIEKLLDKIVKTADYLVCYNDGSQIVRRLIMKFKGTGKHGSVING